MPPTRPRIKETLFYVIKRRGFVLHVSVNFVDVYKESETHIVHICSHTTTHKSMKKNLGLAPRTRGRPMKAQKLQKHPNRAPANVPDHAYR